MTPLTRAEVRDEILRLRGQRMTYREIGQITGVSQSSVQRLCQGHFDDRVKRAAAALKREINLARAEAHTAPLFHPVDWR
jgi:DNA-directed RNA polymerase specialized sigma24 family protein